jgi:Na+-driven multidrug efflux pump
MTRTLLGLAWPLAIAGLLNITIELIAAFWVGRIEGTAGLAVLTGARPLLFCLLFVFGSIHMGATVGVARSIGGGTGEGMRIYAAAGGLVVAMWAVTLVVLLPLMPWIEDLLGDGTLPLLSDYVVPWLVCALPIVIFAHVSVEVAAAAKQTRLALVRTLLDLGAMCALTPPLLYAAGITGAALAAAVSALVLVAVLARTIWRHRIAWQLGELAGARTGMVRRWLAILDVGLPVQLARASTFAAQAFMVGYLAGDLAAQTGYATAVMLLVVGAVISLSVAQSGAILLAQAAGAGDAARVRAAFTTALRWAITVGGATSAAFFVAGRYFMRLFTADPAVLERGDRAITLMSFGLLGIAVWQVLLASMAALKASKRGGLVGVIAEALGVLLVLVWDATPRIDAAIAAFLVSNFVRALVLGALISPALRAATR